MLQQRPAWLRNRTRVAVYCAAALLLAGLLLFQAREQRLATWIRPQALTAAAAVEPWRGHARDPPADNFSVVTIATRATRELQLLLASCPHRVRVLGTGQRYEKYRSKVTLLFDDLMERGEGDVILYVDALDASFFPCHRDLLTEFLAFQADIVFQADDFDWPNVEDNIKNDLFPDPPPGAHPKFRLLCAGVWMGRVGAVRHYLSQYFLAAGHVDGRSWDDQGWWRNLFLAQVYAPAAQARKDPLLAIDYHGRLFQMFRPYATYVRQLEDGTLRCPSIYGNAPACILHAEGPAKGFKDRFSRLLDVYLLTNETTLYQASHW